MKRILLFLVLATSLTNVVIGQGKSGKSDTSAIAKAKGKPPKPTPTPQPPPSNGGWSLGLWNFNISTWGEATGTVTSTSSGVSFNWPTTPYAAMKIMRANTGSLYGNLYVNFTVTPTSGNPQFIRLPESGNTCVDPPPTVRAYIEVRGWHDPPYDPYQRWWSNPISAVIGAGTYQFVIPITPDQWSSVYGEFGNANSAAAQGFNYAMNVPEKVGLTFGGGCFFGHGVYVSGGTATLTIHNMSTGY